MLLARSGLRVLAIDKGSYGSDTLSTHALMRGGVLQLHRWGVLPGIVVAGTPPVRAATFHYGDGVNEAPIRARGGVDALYAPRRTVLDRALVDAARAAGADVRHRVAVVDLVGQRGRISGVDLVDRSGHLARVEADLVIGADGLRSKIAGAVGARVLRRGSHAAAIVLGYWAGMSFDGYAWYYRPGLAGGVIPTNGGEACVFMAVRSDRLRSWIARDLAGGFMQAAAELSPSLADALDAGRRVGALRTFGGAPGFLRQAHGPGWALVGDAGYFKDPVTAHGITDALRDAELLTRAILRGPHCLREYQACRAPRRASA
jgi:flavin-dependent dehydrogenase